MMETTTDFRLQTVPASLSREDILAYFGIPPAPESHLEANIKAKRQFWLKRSNGPGGRELADQVKRDIQNLSKVIEEGSIPDRIIVTNDGKYVVVGDASTVSELCDQLESFLRSQDVSNVVSTARYGLEKWPGDEEATIAVALATSELVRDYPGVDEEARLLANKSAAQAMDTAATDPRSWLSMARCLLANGMYTDVRALEQRGRSTGVELPAEVFGIAAAACFRAGDRVAGIERLVRSVTVSDGDPGVRSVATDAMIAEVLLPMLPIATSKASAEFAEAAAVAAWLARGVPESEADVLPFRLWATSSRTKFFIGDYSLRSFLGVLTCFLAVPLYNKLASRPGWRVLRDGPANRDSWFAWIQVAGDDFVETLHRRAASRFEWEGAPGTSWPNYEQVRAHILGSQ